MVLARRICCHPSIAEGDQRAKRPGVSAARSESVILEAPFLWFHGRTAPGRPHLRRFREERGFSQEAFADHCGLHRTYISGIERGVRNPTVLIVEKIAKALKVSAAELLQEGKPAARGDY